MWYKYTCFLIFRCLPSSPISFSFFISTSPLFPFFRYFFSFFTVCLLFFLLRNLRFLFPLYIYCLFFILLHFFSFSFSSFSACFFSIFFGVLTHKSCIPCLKGYGPAYVCLYSAFFASMGLIPLLHNNETADRVSATTIEGHFWKTLLHTNSLSFHWCKNDSRSSNDLGSR
jgi:hypothetical protein